MPFILGTDCGGEVESVGSGVSKFKVRIAICIRLKAQHVACMVVFAH